MIEPVYLYDDGIGKVEYVEHMGSDLSVVNSARVSFGKHKQLLDEKLSLIHISEPTRRS